MRKKNNKKLVKGSKEAKERMAKLRKMKGKKVKKEGISIRRVLLNNKTRKGNYVAIRETGKKTKYYKEKEGLEDKDYKEFYSRGLVTKRGGVSKERILKEKKLDRVAKKFPKVEDILKSGSVMYTIKKAKGITPQGINNSYKSLLMNRDKTGDGIGIVRDKLLLDLITRPENVEKWKQRIGYEILIKDEKENVMATIRNTQPKTLSEVKREVIDDINMGKEYDSGKEYTPTAGLINNIGKDLEKKGYRIEKGESGKGKISNVSIRMIFQKK